MSERLEEIKSEINGLSVIEDVSYAMLPEDVEKLKVIKLESVKWLINRVEELEKDVKEWEVIDQCWKQINEILAEENERYKQALERMKRHYEIQLQAYGDRHMATYNFDWYDEVRDFIHHIEEILEGFK